MIQKDNLNLIIFSIKLKILIWGSPFIFIDLQKLAPLVLNLSFEKCVNILFFTYEGSIFWGVVRVRKMFDNSVLRSTVLENMFF